MKFNFDIEDKTNELKTEELEKIKEKLFNLHKDRIHLLCKSIKFSVKLMSKIFNFFNKNVEKNENSKISDNDLLIKIKLFLKIIRIVANNLKDLIEKSKNKKEREFFTLYLFF